ncbi:BED-type domain-containing protein, partial [Aphis craccivora]
MAIMDSLDIFESQKGKEKLAFKNFMYVVHKECLNFIRWKCCKKNSHKCPCILKTSLDKKHLIKIDHEHNHLSCQNEIDAAKIKMQIKTQAKVSKSTPAQLFSEAVTGLSEGILEELPKEKSIKKTIQNQRTQNFPKVPDNLKDL